MKRDLKNDVLAAITTTRKTNYDLCSELGIKGATLRSSIHELRLEGHPICSDSNGYWLGNEEEVRVTAARLKSRALNIVKAAWALEKGNEEVIKNQIEVQ